MKGYAGGLVVSTADRVHIDLLGVQAPMMQVSASLSWLGRFGDLAQTED